MLQYVLIGVVVVVIVAVFVFTIVRNNAIKKNGIETDAVVEFELVETDRGPQAKQIVKVQQ